MCYHGGAMVEGNSYAPNRDVILQEATREHYLTWFLFLLLLPLAVGSFSHGRHLTIASTAALAPRMMQS